MIDGIKQAVSSPLFWVGVTALFFIVYLLAGRLVYINIFGTLKSYKKVFNKKSDFVFFMVAPLLLSLTSITHSTVTVEIADLMAVILSILTSMVLTFMSMTDARNSAIKDQKSRENEKKTLSDNRREVRNEDALRVGVYEVTLSVFALIFIFIVPVINHISWVLNIVSILIYYSFYSFLLNILIVVRRLYQVYFPNQ